MTKQTKNLLLTIYYIAISVGVFIVTITIPLQESIEAQISYTNELFVQYKQTNKLQYVDEASEVAKTIRSKGQALGKEKYRELSGEYGLLSAVIVFLLTLLFNFTGPNDCIWIGAGFSVLYGIGALTTESFLGILILAFVTYQVKKWRITKKAK